MPIYEYQCTGCHHHFDLMQKYSDEPAKQCPKCFENTVIKLVSAAGFQLKGTGWYATDFKNKGTTPSESSATKSDVPAKDSAVATKDTTSPKSSEASNSAKGDTK